MWTYCQSSGVLSHNGEVVATGYSGHGEGKDNPQMQDVPMVGPIPVGLYVIGELVQSQTHGPDCMHLTPTETTNTFGRSGFMLHGDSIQHPGQASEGCIILPHSVRLQISQSGDPDLEVTA